MPSDFALITKTQAPLVSKFRSSKYSFYGNSGYKVLHILGNRSIKVVTRVTNSRPRGCAMLKATKYARLLIL